MGSEIVFLVEKAPGRRVRGSCARPPNLHGGGDIRRHRGRPSIDPRPESTTAPRLAVPKPCQHRKILNWAGAESLWYLICLVAKARPIDA
jgi:hypothetical protein